MALDPGIILAGQPVNALAAMNGGTIAAQNAIGLQQQNALTNLYRTQGPGIMAGDAGALNALAGMDPAAALGIQQTQQQMAGDQEQLSMLRTRAAEATAEHAATMNANEVQQHFDEVSRGVQAATTAQSPQEWDALVTQYGAPELAGKFAQRDAVISYYLGIQDGLKTVIDGKTATAGAPDGMMWKNANDPSLGVAPIPGYTPPASGANKEYGLTPVVTQDPKTGQYHLFQVSKDGSPPVEVQLPYGWTPKNQFLDIGTGYTAMPTQGTPQETTIIPKDVAGAAEQTALGKSQGDAGAAAASLEAKMPGLLTVVDQLDKLAETATYTKAGQIADETRLQLGMEPRPEAIARQEYIAIISNQILPLLRDTFGAQFTEAEGRRLMDTLGNPDLQPSAKQAVLKSFIEQKKRDLEALKVQATSSTTAQPSAAASSAGSPDLPADVDALLRKYGPTP